MPGLLTADPVLISKGETEAGSCGDRWPQGGPVQGVHREKDTETQRAERTCPGLGAHSLCPPPPVPWAGQMQPGRGCPESPEPNSPGLQQPRLQLSLSPSRQSRKTGWLLSFPGFRAVLFTLSPDSNANLFWKQPEIMFYQFSGHPLAQSS